MSVKNLWPKGPQEPKVVNRPMTNRAPWDMQRHDTMFDELSNDSSAYNATYDNFRYRIGLYNGSDRIAEVEDLRVVWHDLKNAQCKCRITRLNGTQPDGTPLVVAEFSRTDPIELLIESAVKADASYYSYDPDVPLGVNACGEDNRPQIPLTMEPPKVFIVKQDVSGYNNEPVNPNMTITANKWLYLVGEYMDIT